MNLLKRKISHRLEQAIRTVTNFEVGIFSPTGWRVNNKLKLFRTVFPLKDGCPRQTAFTILKIKYRYFSFNSFLSRLIHYVLSVIENTVFIFIKLWLLLLIAL